MIKCIAIDDSPLALSLIKDYIQRVGDLVLECACTNAAEALKVLQQKKIDLLFTDIRMPDLSGIEVLRGLKEKPLVIFTTAYADYAVEGFNLDAADYLLKPFSFERFLQAVNKARLRLQARPNDMLPAAGETGDFIYVRSGYETIKIFTPEILYIEAMKDYIQIFTSAKKILSLMSMGEVLQLLPKKEFIRVHRSYIVPLSKIDRIAAKKIFVGEKEIPLGEVFRHSFTEQMNRRISGRGPVS